MAEGRREKDLDLVEEFESVRAVTSDGRSVRIPRSKIGGNIEVATENVLGGIKARPKSNTDTKEVKIDPATGRLYVQEGEGTPPDDEDITVAEIEGIGKLQFKDKVYNASSYSGLGRKYLRKNMVDGVNLLTQDFFTNYDGTNKTNTRYIIQYDYDLNGATITIPVGCVLDFQGGSITNGVLFGNNTQLKGDLNNIFRKITIKGIWDVPYISSNMLYDKNTTDNIKNLIALSNPSIQNTIVIEDDVDCNVSVSVSNNTVFSINKNTNLIINGTINLLSNSLEAYNIIDIRSCENVTISGSGTINGDLLTHTGSTGEWGMGVNINDSSNIHVDNINITNCWGDSIYIGGNSENVYVKGCNLKRARRQGISITYANTVEIDSCLISDIYGTDPQSAIDLEPNNGETIENITIKNCIVENCKVGFEIYGYYNTVKNVTVENYTCKNLHENCNVAFYVYNGELVRFKNVRYVDEYEQRSSVVPIFLITKSKNILVDNCNFKIVPECLLFNCGENDTNENIIYTNNYIDAPLSSYIGLIFGAVFKNNIVSCKNLCRFAANQTGLTLINGDIITVKNGSIRIANTFSLENVVITSENGTSITNYGITSISKCTFNGGLTVSNLKEINIYSNKIYKLLNINGSNISINDNVIDIDELYVSVSRSTIKNNKINMSEVIGVEFSNTLFLTNRITSNKHIVISNKNSIGNNIISENVFESKAESNTYILALTCNDTSFSNNVIKGDGVFSYGIYIESEKSKITNTIFDADNIQSLRINLGGASKNIYLDSHGYKSGPTDNRPDFTSVPSMNDNSARGTMFYDASYKSPVWWSGTTWVKADGFGFDVKRIGSSSERPLAGITKGFVYYDTDINKPIWYSGNNWVDATGTVV